MRRFFLMLALAGCFLFSGCDVREMSSLKELSLPYAGEYLCRELRMGERDVLPLFESVVLTLERDGRFSLVYRRKSGGEGGLSGSYTLDGESGLVEFAIEGGNGKTVRSFPYEKGCICIEVPLLDRLFFAKFAPRS